MSSDRKRQVVELLKSIETGDPKPLASVSPDKYIQHNLAVADGVAGLAKRSRSSWEVLSDASRPTLKKWATRLVEADATHQIHKTRVASQGIKEGMHSEELQDV
jgi:hypothetical protein